MSTDDHKDWPEWSAEVVDQTNRDQLSALREELRITIFQRDQLLTRIADFKSKMDQTEAMHRERDAEIARRWNWFWVTTLFGVVAFGINIALIRGVGFGWAMGGLIGVGCTALIVSTKSKNWEKPLLTLAAAAGLGAIVFPLGAGALEKASCAVLASLRWAANGIPPSCAIDLW